MAYVIEEQEQKWERILKFYLRTFNFSMLILARFIGEHSI